MRISDWSSDVCSSDLFFLESGVFLVDAYTDAVAQYLGCGRAFDNDFGQGEVLVADFFQELGLRGQVGECGVEAARVQIDLHLVQCFVRLDMQAGRFLAQVVPVRGAALYADGFAFQDRKSTRLNSS